MEQHKDLLRRTRRELGVEQLAPIIVDVLGRERVAAVLPQRREYDSGHDSSATAGLPNVGSDSLRADGRVGIVVAVQHVGIEIKAVRPNDRPQLRVHPNAPKVFDVTQRLGHRSPQDFSQIDDALGPVIEAQT
jgi:hypothetical protein